MVQTEEPVGLQAHLEEPNEAWLLPGWMKRGKERPKVRAVTVPTVPCWSEHAWGHGVQSPAPAWSVERGACSRRSCLSPVLGPGAGRCVEEAGEKELAFLFRSR